MVQDEKADAAIREHVGYAVAASAIPMPIADVLAVTAVPLDLVRQLARMYEADLAEGCAWRFLDPGSSLPRRDESVAQTFCLCFMNNS